MVLIFPEGTRRTDGLLGDFKPLVGKLALETGVDILPIYLGGTYDVLPKGSFLPKGRELSVRIGPPLPADRMRELTKDMRSSQAARAIAGWARQAVESLRDGEVHDPASMVHLGMENEAPPRDFLEELFGELPGRFQPAELEKPISWYFSLGDERRWTVEVDGEGCRVSRGRPAGGSADCVVKTSPEIVEKIIRRPMRRRSLSLFQARSRPMRFHS